MARGPVGLYGRKRGERVKTCPACMTSIHVEARKCPACHTEFDQADMEAGRAEVSGRGRRKVLLVAALIIAAIVWIAWPGNAEKMGYWAAGVDAEAGR
jgi:hypothetical protein